MKRIVIILALLAPALALLYFNLQPQADRNVNLPTFHFYVVTFITFSAAVVSILLTATLGLEGQPRHVLAKNSAGSFMLCTIVRNFHRHRGSERTHLAPRFLRELNPTLF